MPQIDLIATWQDSLQLLGSILDIPNVAMFADHRYSSQEPLIFNNLSSVQSTTIGSPTRLYIWSSEISPVKPALDKISMGENKGKYWVNPAEHHPFVGFSAYQPQEITGVIKLFPGMIWWKNDWLDPVDKILKPWNDAGKKLVREIRLLVKKQMIRVNLHEPTWVGKEAHKLFKSGELTLINCGREFRITNEGALEVNVPQRLEKLR